MPANMKDSRIEWVGLIPEEWEVLRNKVCFTCSKEIVGSESDATQLLSLTTKGIKTKRPEDITGKVPETYDTYQLVEPNDLVMCLFDLDVSAVFSGRSSYYGMISPAYKVLKCNDNITPKFAEYWFDFVFDGRKFKHYSKNLRYTLNYDEFAALPIIVPKREAQEKIASFLDSECARIDSVIEKTQASIEENKKLKQAIITEAVTKGIHQNREMKDSGVDWIGEVPADWRILNLNTVTECMRNGYVGPTKDLFFDDGVKYIQSLHIKEGKIDFSRHEYYVSKEWADVHPKIRENDILIVQTGDIGNVGLVTADYDGCNCHALIIATPRMDLVVPEYLIYYLRSVVGKELLLYYKTGALLPHLNSGKIKFATVCVPSIQEQKDITNYLNSEIARIDEVISKKEALLDELEKYKKSLIYEYITGKKGGV